MRITKTNAARILEGKKIPYELMAYETDVDDLSATHVAMQLGEPIEQVFKTLVLRGDKTGVFVCIIPGAEEVNLKFAAKTTGNKSCDLVLMKEIQELTGYIRGGCSPLGMKKNYPTYIHETAVSYPFIYISAGVRGLQIKLNPHDLIQCCAAMVCRLA
jgi:Cys-tRNA(Pro)/Cys-tRNA(Cys) deacylase